KIDRVPTLIRGEVFDRPVEALIVAAGMGAEPIHVTPEDGRTAAGPRLLNGLRGRVMHRERIPGVDVLHASVAERAKTVREEARSGRADAITVVLDQVDDRQGFLEGERNRLVELAFTNGGIADRTDDNAAGAFHFRAPGRACRRKALRGRG